MASHRPPARPPRPPRRPAGSDAHRKKSAVSSLEVTERSPNRLLHSCRHKDAHASKTSPNASSEIGSPFSASDPLGHRSAGAGTCRSRPLSPVATSSDVTIRAVDVLPFVPVMWIAWYRTLRGDRVPRTSPSMRCSDGVIDFIASTPSFRGRPAPPRSSPGLDAQSLELGLQLVCSGGCLLELRALLLDDGGRSLRNERLIRKLVLGPPYLRLDVMARLSDVPLAFDLGVRPCHRDRSRSRPRRPSSRRVPCPLGAGQVAHDLECAQARRGRSWPVADPRSPSRSRQGRPRCRPGGP